MKHHIKMQTVIDSIKTPNDVKLAINRQFEDDHLQCAHVDINGTEFRFLWFDDLGFLTYFDESPRAFKTLLGAMKNCADMIVT